MINTFSFFWPLLALAFFLIVGVVFFVGFIKGREKQAYWEKLSKKQSRSVLGGVFSEQVAPFLPDFPKDLKASEARFIGKPVDFLVFKGMDEQNISEVVFVEIKSGQSQLSVNQRKLRDAINDKRVRWYEYRTPNEITKISEEPA